MTLRQATDRRLLDIREIARSGVTELTGRGIRETPTGATVGRIGGLKPAFPELFHLSESPKQIATAIDRGSGPLYERVRDVVSRAMEGEGFEEPRRRARKPDIAPHTGRVRCSLCGQWHSKDAHRFHGPGSFHRTHLFGFHMKNRGKKNPGLGRKFYFFGKFRSKILAARSEREHPGSFILKRGSYYFVLKEKARSNPRGLVRLGRLTEIRYERDFGRHPGFYKHQVKSRPDLYFNVSTEQFVLR